MKKKYPFLDFVTYEGTNKFKWHPRNRAIDRKHLQEIKKQMMVAFASMPAIIVNILTMVIIDGQHRLAAFRALIESGFFTEDTQLPVQYVYLPVEKELDEIIAAQLHQKRWTPADYIQSNIKDGNESYIKLDEFVKTHSLCIDGNKSKPRYAAAMMKGKNCQQILLKGEFTVTDEEIKTAEEIHSELMAICSITKAGTTGTWVEAMAISWYRNRTIHSWDSWIEMFKRHHKYLISRPKQKISDWDALFAQVSAWINQEKLVA